MRKPLSLLGPYSLGLPIVFAVGAVILVLPPFFQADDFGILGWLRNEVVSPRQLFTVWPMGLWRPFSLACLWLENQIFDTNPSGYRLVHGAVFLASIILYYRLVVLLTGSQSHAWMSAVLLAATYSHWEAVEWICAANELWVGFFGLGLWISLIRYHQTQQYHWMVIAITAQIFALLAKENAVILLPIGILLLYDQPFSVELRKPWIILGLFLPWLSALGGRILIAAQGEAVHSQMYSLWGRHVIHNGGAYLLRMTLPWITAPAFLPACVVFLGIGILLLIFMLQKRCSLVIGLLWTFLALFPYLGINVPDYQPSRYVYLAGMGWFFFLSTLIEIPWFFSPERRKTVYSVVCFFCLFNLGLYIFHHEIRYWQKDDALYRSMVVSLKQLSLPKMDSIMIKNLPFADHPEAEKTFRSIYSLVEPPPEKIGLDADSESNRVDFILEWNGERFVVLDN